MCDKLLSFEFIFVNYVYHKSKVYFHIFSVRFAFRIYDIDDDGFISNGELFTVLKIMVGENLDDIALQQIVDKTIIYADEDGDGKLSFEEFKKVIDKLNITERMTIEQIHQDSSENSEDSKNQDNEEKIGQEEDDSDDEID